MKDKIQEFIVVSYTDDRIYSFEKSTLKDAMFLVEDLRETYPRADYRLYKQVTSEDY